MLNRVTTAKGGNITPFELWHKKKPDISNIHVFGSEYYSQVPKALRRKLDQKAVRRIFIGFQGESNNYKLFDPETRKFHHATNVRLDEVGDFEFATIITEDDVPSDWKKRIDDINTNEDKDEKESEELERSSELMERG